MKQVQLVTIFIPLERFTSVKVLLKNGWLAKPARSFKNSTASLIVGIIAPRRCSLSKCSRNLSRSHLGNFNISFSRLSVFISHKHPVDSGNNRGYVSIALDALFILRGNSGSFSATILNCWPKRFWRISNDFAKLTGTASYLWTILRAGLSGNCNKRAILVCLS